MAPVASAATTGSAQAIASRVTLPKASVTEGFKRTSELAQRSRKIGAGQLAQEDRVRQLLLEPGPRRSLADDDNAMLEAKQGEGVDRVGEDVETLFHDDPAKEAHDQLVVGDAKGSPPRHVAAARD